MKGKLPEKISLVPGETTNFWENYSPSTDCFCTGKGFVNIFETASRQALEELQTPKKLALAIHHSSNDI